VTVTLYHNNHHWEGANPLTALLQGGGVAATLFLAGGCALWLRRWPPRGALARLFLIWMIYNGCLQALPQIALGSVYPENDAGMALAFLDIAPAARQLLGIAALVCVPLVAFALAPALLAFGAVPALLATARARFTFMGKVASLPAFLAILLIVPFRVPRDPIEVLAPPLVVAFIGTVWLQVAAVRERAVVPRAGEPAPLYPLAALLALLLVFQLLLRPGIRL
jgi:hypothetical protein